jgi:succinate dehydrogenase/fumarate reductase flavoprotein subunit
MASELVRTKVENQELQDSVESLKGQVEELRNLVERQPEEVENRLKEEMDRIMKRNVEVQNENRSLEEQMADMEKALVETKMKNAEVPDDIVRFRGSTDKIQMSSEHDNLKQKWNDLRRAIEA